MDEERMQRLLDRLAALGAERHDVTVDWEDVREVYGVLPPEPYRRIMETFHIFQIRNDFSLMDPFLDIRYTGPTCLYYQEDLYGFHVMDCENSGVAPRPFLPEDGSMFAWASSSGQFLTCEVKDRETLPEVYLFEYEEIKYIGPDIMSVIEGMLDMTIPPPAYMESEWEFEALVLRLYEQDHSALLPKYQDRIPREPVYPVR